MDAFCIVDLDEDRYRRDIDSGGSGDYRAICMAFLDGGWHRNAT
jgi:hypothetical protein